MARKSRKLKEKVYLIILIYVLVLVALTFVDFYRMFHYVPPSGIALRLPGNQKRTTHTYFDKAINNIEVFSQNIGLSQKRVYFATKEPIHSTFAIYLAVGLIIAGIFIYK